MHFGSCLKHVFVVSQGFSAWGARFWMWKNEEIPRAPSFLPEASSHFCQKLSPNEVKTRFPKMAISLFSNEKQQNNNFNENNPREGSKLSTNGLPEASGGLWAPARPPGAFWAPSCAPRNFFSFQKCASGGSRNVSVRRSATRAAKNACQRPPGAPKKAQQDPR